MDATAQTPRILVVDDTLDNLLIVEAILKEDGYDIVTAMNGHQALAEVAQQAFDLILLDVMMPEIDGFEVCRRLKGNPATTSIPVIFLTALNDADSIQRAFTIGGVDYVTKPFKPEELLARVSTHIRLRRTEQELRSLNSAKDKFISIVAHELRGPFAGLRGVLGMIDDDYANLGTAELRSYLSMSRHTADNLGELLGSLLAWSNLQQGALAFQPRPLDLRALVDDTLYQFGEAITNKRLHTDIQVQDGTFVRADREMARTILRNLVSNAIMFNRAGGEIHISALDQGGMTEVQIVDTGVGMSPDEQRQLFRLDSGFKRLGTQGETGVGMGLILCRELVDRHAGEIWLESEPEKGTRVHFTLPKNSQ